MLTLIRILSRLPLGVLYALMQGLLYPMAYYVVRYRRKVVCHNLAQSFPDQTARERKRMEKAFYHFFCDLMAEIIHGYRASDEEMRRRVVIEGLNEREEEILRHGGAFMMLGHLGCWEWIADAAKRYDSPQIKEYAIYRTLKSASANRAILALRAKRGGGCIEKKQLIRQMVRLRGGEEVPVYCLLSDQKPSKTDLDCRTPFLHQSTPFITGGERLAVRFDYPVYYVHILRPKRGYYKVQVQTIASDPQHNPAEAAEGYITRRYAALLEQNILEQPEIWLWSHNRFKYSKPL